MDSSDYAVVIFVVSAFFTFFSDSSLFNCKKDGVRELAKNFLISCLAFIIVTDSILLAAAFVSPSLSYYELLTTATKFQLILIIFALSVVALKCFK